MIGRKGVVVIALLVACCCVQAGSAGGLGGPLALPQEAHLGTFTYVQKRATGEFSAIVINVEPRSGAAQITGTIMSVGKVGADIRGTYYPTSNSFRGTVKERGGERKEENLDGKFLPGENAYDLWTDGPEGKGRIIHVTRIDSSNVEGTYDVKEASLTVRRTGSGFEVSGTYAGRQVRGSFYLVSNQLAARASEAGTAVMVPINIDGHYDPAENRLCIWTGPEGGGSDSRRFLALSKSDAGKRPATGIVAGDPATRPGAVWNQSETWQVAIGGTWTLDPSGKQFLAKWANGAEATLTLVTCTATTVVVTRDDRSGVSKGLRATYRGTRTGSRVNGKVDWTWPNGRKGNGTWTATLPSK